MTHELFDVSSLFTSANIFLNRMHNFSPDRVGLFRGDLISMSVFVVRLTNRTSVAQGLFFVNRAQGRSLDMPCGSISILLKRGASGPPRLKDACQPSQNTPTRSVYRRTQPIEV